MSFAEAGSCHHRRRQGVAMLACLCLAPSAAMAREDVTPDDARNAVAVIDDPLEREMTFSTEPVLRSTRGVFRTPHNDTYLLAAMDRASGQVRFEVRQTFNYEGPYRQYEQVSYEGVELPRTAGLQLIETNRDHCQAFDSGTACREVAAFGVPEADLRIAAGGSAGDHPDAWELKFKPQNGREHRTRLPRAEVAALLQTVEAHRASRLAQATTAYPHPPRTPAVR